MDMLSSLQAEYIGSTYYLQEIYLYKDDSGTNFYVDAIHIGKNPTTYDFNGREYLGLVTSKLRCYLYNFSIFFKNLFFLI